MDNLLEKKYLSSKDAGAILGYTHDYVSRLCRQGKMSGIQKGREWYVTQEEIDAFKLRHEVELAEKKKELSKKFSQIRKEAEAKKRKAREQATTSSLVEVSQPKSPYESTRFDQDTEPKQVTLKFPKQLAAALVLFLCIIVPSFITSFKNQGPQQNFTQNFEQDVATTQFVTVRQTAAILEVGTVMSRNIDLFFSNISNLPHETYASLYTLGTGYLKLYLLQGEALYYSFQNLNTVGATVLVGYELIGQSFWYGSQDIMEKFSTFFSQNTFLKIALNFPKQYVMHVAGGFEYVMQDASQTAVAGAFAGFANVIDKTQTNIALNISSISNTLSTVSGSTSAYVGSLFEFNLVEKEAKIKAIRLQQ